MIKAKGKDALAAEGFRYISALTDAQVRTLLKQGVLQPDLFDQHLCEVVLDNKRLILRRNDAVRIRETRRKGCQPYSDGSSVIMTQFVALTLNERSIDCSINEAAQAEDALLDGCYILETDVPAALMAAKTVDERYRDLQKVERNFRTIKTTFLEIRPIFVRKANRTKAHVFVAMLALKITRHFEACLRAVFATTDDDPHAITPDDALVALGRLTYLYQTHHGKRIVHLPRPDEHQANILRALGITFPTKPKISKRTKINKHAA